MDDWLTTIGDNPDLPEKDLIQQLWDGQDAQPVTATPVVTIADGTVSISCATEGASIGYQVVGADGVRPDSWRVYQEPFVIGEGNHLLVRAHRIGFWGSEVVEVGALN